MRAIEVLALGLSVVLGSALAGCSGSDAVQAGEGSALAEEAEAISTCTPSPTTHCGDVQISGQAQANQYQGIQLFVGNVILKGGQVLYSTDQNGNQFWVPDLVFSMPSLKKVNGNLTIEGGRMATIDLPALQRVAGNLTVGLHHFMTAPPTNLHAVTTLNTPSFTQLAGSIVLTASRDPDVPSNSIAHVYDFGLDTLTSVSGDITVTNDKLPATVSALGGLTKVLGNLAIDWKNSDMSSSGLLEKVTQVQGNLTLTAPINSRALMPELQTVGGEVQIKPSSTKVTLQQGKVFPKLATIGGGLRLSETNPYDCHAELKSLAQVGGTILIEDTKMLGYLGSTGAVPLVAGGVEIRAASSGPIPFYPDFQLAPGASVEIHDNPNLCPCTIQSFQAALAAAGFSGPFSSYVNGSLPFCLVCPTCP
jgi:hypothetical protein